MRVRLPAALCFLLLAVRAFAADAPFSPREAPGHMTLPPGFQAQLFAGEPDLVQPIAFTIDDRGRIWAVECISYPNWLPEGKEGRDRVLIFEDSDGDGRFDSRKVFFDKGTNLSGIEIGFGGVWLCATPYLLFIPDRNGDDVPDGPPVVVLDGWDLKAKHNVFNGLAWGPDGWLYGLNGILSISLVGRPGAPASERTPLNCGVWRYQPLERRFEVVAWGTTNPWGLDFDDQGEIFITNCVIAHLWHVIPGGHYQRMFGDDMNPHLYSLMESCADHLHWAGGPWQGSRGGAGAHGEAGGGHAHAGAMVYLGDNWPPEYRGSLFTCNLHGSRVNRDLLERSGSGYRARHGKDFLLANDPWFRGLNLKYGPDGGVFVSDWTDTGECHDYDDVHQASGRIYKVTYGKTTPARVDLGKLPDGELVRLQLHPNDWYVRHARRILMERAAAGSDLTASRQELERMLATNPETTRKLRALWALRAAGGLPEGLLLEELSHADEHLRAWAARFLAEGKDPSEAALERFRVMAAEDPSPLVRMTLGSLLQRIPLEKRWAIAGPLAAHGEDQGDRNIPLLLWYAVEPLIAASPERALPLLSEARIPLLREFAARRLAAAAGGLPHLARWLSTAEDSQKEAEVLQGMREALRGRTDQGEPPGWAAVYPGLSASASGEVREKALLLAAIFGSGPALASLRETLLDAGAPKEKRETALAALVERRDRELPSLLRRLIGSGGLRGAALRGLAAFDEPSTPGAILAAYSALSEPEKTDALTTLASRPGFAGALLSAMEEGRVPARDLSPYLARQIERLGDPGISERLRKVWGVVRPAAGDKVRLLERYRSLLTQEPRPAADRSRGRAVFERSCATCHTLFGSGGAIGPDLTGSQRSNLDYILENLLDPSGLVASEYQMTVVQTRDGRLLSGIIKREDEHTVTVQTANEAVILERGRITVRTRTELSLMPEGLLEKMKDQEARDLVAYLQGAGQAPLPSAAAISPSPAGPAASGGRP